MKYKFLFLIALSLIYIQLIAGRAYPQDQNHPLFLKFKTMLNHESATEKQVMLLLNRLGYAYVTPEKVAEITRMLRMGEPDHLLEKLFVQLAAGNRRSQYPLHPYSFDPLSFSMTSRNPLAIQSSTGITPVLEDFQVNENPPASRCGHSMPAIAVAPDRQMVVAWWDWRNVFGDVYCQRYDENGLPVGENMILSEVTGSPFAIAMDGDANFLVVWSGEGQWYTKEGTPKGDKFVVMDSLQYCEYFDIVIGDDGNFIVAWCDEVSNILGQRYNAAGAPLEESFIVNDIPNTGCSPAVAMDSNGNFVVIWDEVVENSNIRGQYYNANGDKVGNNFLITDEDENSRQDLPRIAMDPVGNFMVSWIDWRDLYVRGYAVYGQFYSSDRLRQGNNFKVCDGYSDYWSCLSDVGVDNQGNFVAVWGGIYAQRYSNDFAAIGSNLKVNDVDNSTNNPVLAVNNSGQFMVVWEDSRHGSEDIFGQRFNADGSALENNFLINDDDKRSDQRLPVIDVDGDGDFVVIWNDNRNGNYRSDIYGQCFSKTGISKGVNFKINSDDRWENSHPNLAVAKSGSFLVVWESSFNLYGQLFSENGSPIGENFKINEIRNDRMPVNYDVAVDSSGNFIVVWQQRSQSASGIYAQRYSDSGIPQGENLWVSKFHNAVGATPAVAVDASGRVLIVWSDWRSEPSRIYGQLFNADGLWNRQDFKISNDSTSAYDRFPDVSCDGNGNFVIIWKQYLNLWGEPGNYSGQFCTADRELTGGNFKLDEITGAESISMNRKGDFVVSWSDDGEDGSRHDIYAKFFNSQGQPLGSIYRVNNDFGNNLQDKPNVKLFSKYVYYTWEDTRVPGQGFDVFARVDEFDGNSGLVTPLHRNQPHDYALYNNYPNPFNPSTTITYALPQSGHVQIQIFDINGRLVYNSTPGSQETGLHSFVWDGRDTNGKLVCSGIYISRLKAGRVVLHQKMILAK